MLIGEAFVMFEQLTLWDTSSITSSQALEDGPSPSEWRDGATIEKSGREAVPASPLVSPMPQESESKTSATYYQNLPTSSASISLQSSLESKFLELSAKDGLMKPLGVWKRMITPARRQYFQLSLSAQDMKESGFIGWPTPAARDGQDISRSGGGIPSFSEKKIAEYGDPLADAWKALDGGISGLLLSDGLSVAMERKKVRGYGNAIVPQAAAFFIRTVMAI